MQRALPNPLPMNALPMRARLSPIHSHPTMQHSLLADILPASYSKPTSITHGDITLRVTGLSWEQASGLGDTVHACGFDSLTVNDSVTLDSMEALVALAPCLMVARIVVLLDIQAQLDSDQWVNDARRLRHWLGRPC